MTYTGKSHCPRREASLAVFNRGHELPLTDYRCRQGPPPSRTGPRRQSVQRRIRSCPGHRPYTYHAYQKQFRHAQAIVCDLDSCDLAAAFRLVQRVAARTYAYLPSAPARPFEPRAFTREAAACTDKSAAALEELVRQLADLTSGNRNETG